VIENEPCRVVTAHGHVLASDVLVLTQCRDQSCAVLTKVAAYRTYAVAGKILASALGMALYYDMDDPYHYVRRHDVDGQPYANHWRSRPQDRQRTDTSGSFTEIESFARSLFPGFVAETQWSGQILKPRMACRSRKNPGQASRLRCHRVFGQRHDLWNRRGHDAVRRRDGCEEPVGELYDARA